MALFRRLTPTKISEAQVSTDIYLNVVCACVKMEFLEFLVERPLYKIEAEKAFYTTA